jgi:hypothetical protein
LLGAPLGFNPIVLGQHRPSWSSLAISSTRSTALDTILGPVPRNLSSRAMAVYGSASIEEVGNQRNIRVHGKTYNASALVCLRCANSPWTTWLQSTSTPVAPHPDPSSKGLHDSKNFHVLAHWVIHRSLLAAALRFSRSLQLGTLALVGGAFNYLCATNCA